MITTRNLLIPVLYSVSEQIALDQLRDDRSHPQLDAPLLSANVRVVDHILSCQTKPNGKWVKFHHLADPHPKGNGLGVAILVRLPVRQDIAGISNAPAVG